MALLGLPAMRFVESEDRDERLLMLGLLDRAVHHIDVLHRNLAVHIVNTYAKARR